MERIEIATRRLQLKPLSIAYLQTVKEYALDIDNAKYMCHLPNSTEEETADFLSGVDAEWQKDNPGFFEFAILYGGRHIGAVSIYIEGGRGELGWIINKKYWRQGFAYEAADAMIKYFADNMGMTHFIAHCDTENIASYKVMEKLGMERTGEWGGRRNRAASQDSFEYQYELILPGETR